MPEPGVPPAPGELSRRDLEEICKLAARSLLSSGAGEGPNQADEKLYGTALADIIEVGLRHVSAVSGVSSEELFAGAFGPAAPTAARYEYYDGAAVRIELAIRGLL